MVSQAGVFPESDKSKTILACLSKELKKSKVKIIYNFRVTKIKRESDGFTIFNERKETVRAKRIVLATGGKSYPQTGSTGDGYRLAKNLGHQIIPLKPALDKNQLKKRIFREIHKMPKKQFRGLLKTLLPKLLIHFTSQTIGFDEKILNADLTAQEVQRLIEFLKEFSFSIEAAAPLSTAIITSGGVDVDQIDSKNMESKIVPTGWLAGLSV